MVHLITDAVDGERLLDSAATCRMRGTSWLSVFAAALITGLEPVPLAGAAACVLPALISPSELALSAFPLP